MMIFSFFRLKTNFSMAMGCFIGFLRSRRFFRHQSCKHLTHIRQFRDGAFEVDSKKDIPMHFTSFVFEG